MALLVVGLALCAGAADAAGVSTVERRVAVEGIAGAPAVEIAVEDGKRGLAPIEPLGVKSSEEAGAVVVEWRAAKPSVTFSARFEKRGGLTLCRLRMTNGGASDAWLKPKLRVQAPESATTFWDGCETAEDRKIWVRKEFANTFPMCCAFDATGGVAVGLDPTRFVSYIEHGRDGRTNHIWQSIKIVVRAGRSETLDFAVFSFAGAHGKFDALQVFFDAFPAGVNIHPGVDPRLRGGYCGGIVLAKIQDAALAPEFSTQEFARRTFTQWDWYFRPARYNAFIADRREHWGEPEPFEQMKYPWGTTVPGWKGGTALEHHIAAHQKWIGRGKRAGVAAMYYFLSHGDKPLTRKYFPDSSAYRQEDLIDGYKIDGHWGDYQKRGSLRLFPWGNKFADALKADMKTVIDRYPIRGFAWDSNRVAALYRHPATLENCPGWAFDDDGVYVRDSLGYGMMIDYVHSLKLPDGATAGMASNLGPPRQSYLISLRADTTIAEMNVIRVVGQIPDFAHDRIMRGRRSKTQLSGLWRDPLGKFFPNIDGMSPADLREALRNLSRTFSLICLHLGIYPEPDSCLGYEPMMDLIPAIDACAKAGWQPSPAMLGPEGVWLARWGEGPETYLTICNPVGDPPKALRGAIKIENRYLGPGATIVGDFFDAPQTCSLKGDTTEVGMELDAGRAKVLKTLGAIETDSAVEVVSLVDDKADRLGLQWTLKAAKPGAAARVRVAVPSERRAGEIAVNGKAVEFETADGWATFDMTVGAKDRVDVALASTVFLSPEAALLDFPFVTKDWKPACAIVVPDEPTEAQTNAAFHIQEYFRFYHINAVVEWDLLKPPPPDLMLPIVKASEAPEGRPLVFVGVGDAAPGVSRQDEALSLIATPTLDESELSFRLMRVLDKRYPYLGRIRSHMAKALQRGNPKRRETWAETYAGKNHPKTQELLKKAGVLFGTLRDSEEAQR